MWSHVFFGTQCRSGLLCCWNASKRRNERTNTATSKQYLGDHVINEISKYVIETVSLVISSFFSLENVRREQVPQIGSIKYNVFVQPDNVGYVEETSRDKSLATTSQGLLR